MANRCNENCVPSIPGLGEASPISHACEFDDEDRIELLAWFITAGLVTAGIGAFISVIAWLSGYHQHWFLHLMMLGALPAAVILPIAWLKQRRDRRPPEAAGRE